MRVGVTWCCVFLVFAVAGVWAKESGGATTSTSTTEEGVFHYTVEHSLSSHTGEDVWTPRGTLTLSYSDISRSSGGLKFSGEHALHSLQLKLFQTAMEHDGYYRIRMRRLGSDSDSDGKWIQAAVSACALASSSFRELYEFHSDPYGNLVAISYSTPTSVCRDDIRHQQLTGKSVNIVSKGTITFGRAGERPKNIRTSGIPGTPPQPGQQGESGQGSEGEEKKEEKSFLQKYWMYLVPLVLFTVISAASPPEEPAGRNNGRK